MSQCWAPWFRIPKVSALASRQVLLIPQGPEVLGTERGCSMSFNRYEAVPSRTISVLL